MGIETLREAGTLRVEGTVKSILRTGLKVATESHGNNPGLILHSAREARDQPVSNPGSLTEGAGSSKKELHCTLGLWLLQWAVICFSQQLRDSDLGWPTSAPLHLGNLLALRLLGVARSTPLASNCLNPGWDLLC